MEKLPQVLSYELEPYLSGYELENFYDAFPDYLDKSRLKRKKYTRSEMLDMFVKDPRRSAKFFDLKDFIVSWTDDEHIDVLCRNPEVVYKLRTVVSYKFLSSVLTPISEVDAESYMFHLNFNGYKDAMDWPSNQGAFWYNKEHVYYQCIKKALETFPKVYVVLPEEFFAYKQTIADYNFYKRISSSIGKKILQTKNVMIEENGRPSQLNIIVQRAKPHGGLHFLDDDDDE